MTLSLEEALQQARANSPAYRQTLNDAGPAKWGVRNAYGSLLPSVNVSSDLGYTGSGQSNFGGGFVRPTSAFVTSGYSLGLQWQLDGRVLTAPGPQKALRRATDEDISGAGVELRAEIETQYLTTLQAGAQVAVARQQVVRNAEFLKLAKRAIRWARRPCSTCGRRRSPRGRAMWRCSGPCRQRMRRSSIWCAGWGWSRPRPWTRSPSAIRSR